jgi:hypothetical protein
MNAVSNRAGRHVVWTQVAGKPPSQPTQRDLHGIQTRSADLNTGDSYAVWTLARIHERPMAKNVARLSPQTRSRRRQEAPYGLRPCSGALQFVVTAASGTVLPPPSTSTGHSVALVRRRIHSPTRSHASGLSEGASFPPRLLPFRHSGLPNSSSASRGLRGELPGPSEVDRRRTAVERNRSPYLHPPSTHSPTRLFRLSGLPDKQNGRPGTPGRP